MSRALVVVAAALLALAGCRSEEATCRRMKDLCGTSRDECKDLLTSTRETLGDKGVEAVTACFADAKSCSEASGCVAGAGLQGLTDSAGDFLKGMEKGLERK